MKAPRLPSSPVQKWRAPVFAMLVAAGLLLGIVVSILVSALVSILVTLLAFVALLWCWRRLVRRTQRSPNGPRQVTIRPWSG
jgi:hypothetical protein